MCGIAGKINFYGVVVQPTLIKTMMQKIKHRGPDDEGTFFESNVGLGFVRLSILDLSAEGHQPMSDDSGRFVIVYNGESYNYLELRTELQKKGYRFHSGTDTEVVLKGYMEWGASVLNRLNGMFVFAIYDNVDKKLFIARDRFGIKPFYYYLDEEQFVFASEIPALLAVLPEKKNVNYQAIFDYMVFNRTDQTESTFFTHIKKLQHAHTIQIDTHPNKQIDSTERVKINRWYNLSDHLDRPFSSPEEFREMFRSSIQFRLRSDVPVGVCLSGGLDSSTIVSILLHDFGKKDLNTFSAVYESGSTGDESKFIQEYSGQLDRMHFTTPTADSLYDDLSLFVRAHGEPVPATGPYAQFKVMQLAKEHVVVTLDGQGADEELAGYHYFFGFYFKELLLQFRWLRLLTEIVYYHKKHNSFYGLKTLLYFLLPEALKTSSRVKEKGYLVTDFSAAYSGGNQIAGQLYEAGNLSQALFNHFEYKLEHLLKWEDRNSMWFSLEARVPFLDHRLVEKTLALPSSKIIHQGTTKYILRQAMRDILPASIYQRQDKIGFMTPQDEWFRTEKFKAYIVDMLQSQDFQDLHIVHADKALDIYKKHLARQTNASKEIWKWINLYLWFKLVCQK